MHSLIAPILALLLPALLSAQNDGDPLYTRAGVALPAYDPPLIERPALHAWSLTLTHPTESRPLELIARTDGPAGIAGKCALGGLDAGAAKAGHSGYLPDGRTRNFLKFCSRSRHGSLAPH